MVPENAFSGQLDIKSLALLVGTCHSGLSRRRHLQLWRRQAEVDLLSYLEVPVVGWMIRFE